MEREIGDIFEYFGTTLEVVKSDECDNCYFNCFKDSQIIKLSSLQHYDINRFPDSIEPYNLADKEVCIPKDLADDIMNLVKEKIKKLQEEFDNFKTE